MPIPRVIKSSRLSKLTMGLGIFGLILFGGSGARAQSSDACEAAVSQMGYPIDNHSFESGGLFSYNRHIFGDVVCEVRLSGEIRKIERDGQILAEDGVFGLAALDVRRKAEQTSENRLAEARQQRDAAIAEAYALYEAKRQEQRSDFNELARIEGSHLEDLLQGLRDGVLDEDAAKHFNIPPDSLDEEEYLIALRDRREKEREAEKARIEHEKRRLQLSRERREGERRRKESAAKKRQNTVRQRREDVLGIPVEPTSSIRGATNFPEDDVLRVAHSGIEMIHARGWTCDSVSQVSPFWNADGITIKCNNFRYHYEFADRGGQWLIELK